MFYTVYKITNLVNGKIYVGAHKTNDLNDEYMGSGKILIRAIKKYGLENFEKEYICIFDKASDMFEMESQIVNNVFVKNLETYNLKLGGSGGFDHINNFRTIEERKQISSLGGQAAAKSMTVEERKLNSSKGVAVMDELRKDLEWMKEYGDKISKANKGKSKTEEHKRKIGEANSKKQKGSGNSQFGTMWITNGIDAKKIPKTDAIPRGFRRGRK
jgi:hypothetical protein